MTKLTKPKAILFDWDGTIVDSFASIVAGNNSVREKFALEPFTPDQVREAMAIGPARKIFETLYADRAKEALDVYYTHMPKLRATNLQLMEHAADMLRELDATGIPLGVVSNMSHAALLDEIRHIGFYDNFKTIIGAGEAHRGKPAPDPIYLAAERMGMNRHDLGEIWYVGDMETDQKAARAAGCPFIFYAHGITNEAEKRALKPDHLVENYAEFKDMAKRLFSPS